MESRKPIQISLNDCIKLDGIYQPVAFAFRIPGLLIGSSRDSIQYINVMMDLKTGLIRTEGIPDEMIDIVKNHNQNISDDNPESYG